MTCPDDPARWQKVKLLALMCLIALLTLATDGSNGCCPNPEDGQPPPIVIAMQVIVDPPAQEVESGEESSVTVTTQCSLKPCPPILRWVPTGGWELTYLDAEPTPNFRFRASVAPVSSLRHTDYNPFRNQVERRASITFRPDLDPGDASITSVSGGTAWVTVIAPADDPEVTSLWTEEGLITLGSVEKSFGAVSVGSTSAQYIFAWNRGSTPVECTEMKLEPIDPPDALDHFYPHSWSGSILLQPGKGIPIEFVFSPQRAGKARVLLSVFSRVSGETHKAVTVLSGTGVTTPAVALELDGSGSQRVGD